MLTCNKVTTAAATRMLKEATPAGKIDSLPDKRHGDTKSQSKEIM